MPAHESPLPLEIDCPTLQQMLKSGESFLLLDCREQKEYDVARIPGSTLIPMSEIAQRVEELAPHKNGRIVVHCHHGGRSLRVTHWLKQQGFQAVQNLAGGIDDWSQRVDPSVPRY